MGAIDLLFDVKRDSERLHQLVLGALLSQTRLCDRLVPRTTTLPAADPDGAKTEDRTLVFDPLGKAFDLAVLSRGARVLIEVKLDTAISEDHLAQQLSRTQDGDQVLLLLLGYSALSTDRASLRERIARIGHHSHRPDLIDRVHLRDARDLIPLLSDPTLLSPLSAQPDHRQRDARDLAMSYRDALWILQERLRSYSVRPLAEWGDGELYGLYAACRDLRPDGALRIGRLPSADGTVLGCRLRTLPVRGGNAQLELALEGTRLCLRLLPQPGAGDSRKHQREAAAEALRRVGLSRPALHWSEAAPRLTAVMTLATSDVLQAAAADPGHAMVRESELQPGGRVALALDAADDTLRKVAALLAP
jgi:hypothetical protein